MNCKLKPAFFSLLLSILSSMTSDSFIMPEALKIKANRQLQFGDLRRAYGLEEQMLCLSLSCWRCKSALRLAIHLSMFDLVIPNSSNSSKLFYS